MKKYLFIAITLLFVLLPLSARSNYPVQGIYVISSITGGDIVAPSLPNTTTYRNYISDKAFLIRANIDNPDGEVHLQWQVETMPYQEEPFGTKLIENPDGSIVHSWYNVYIDFMDFPQNTWINETYTKVQNDKFIERIADVFSHVDEKRDSLGMWKRVSVRIVNEDSDTLRPASGFKIMGRSNCLIFEGSLYNIEAVHPALLRDFHWKSPEEYTEAGVTYHIENKSPTQYVVKFEQSDGSIVYETWIRYDVPEPLKFLMNHF